jgi:D-alanyl-lipoteichoic acid acyltransferase DltB (MBOAT superfamily)
MKFNFFFSIPFWIAFCAIALFMRLLDRKPTLRRPLLLVASILMVLSIPGFTPQSLGSLLLLCAFSYSTCYVLTRRSLITDGRARKLVSTVGIFGVLGFLSFYKYGFIQSLVLGNPSPGGNQDSNVVFMIGVSYFSFKMIHAIVES